MSDLPKRVRILEEGPREGFQIEKGPIPTSRKIDLINSLSETGLEQIQVTSFVSPTAVPQMADAEELVKGFHSSEFVVKHFCSVCGSSLISTYDNDPEKIGVPLGGLDQAPTNKAEGHFFVGSKAPWLEITDGLPQYETWPGSLASVRRTSGES